ncbi:MAG: glycoside hydrolase family 3 protein, partial [Acidimicrobiia bacterium]|nr:glycoside hydrolase family 3 protein [Acidimicrobiia bacterium]
MKHRLLLLLAALVVLFTACTRQTTSPETQTTSSETTSTTSAPATSQADWSIELVEFSDHLFGAEGLVPAGWTEIQYGVVVSADETTKGVIQQAAPGATAAEVLSGLAAQLELEEAPDATGTFQTDQLNWTLYSFETRAPVLGGVKLLAGAALAESDYGAFVVGLFAPPDEYDALHEAVFLPALEAFTPPQQLPPPEPSAPYRNASVAVDERVEDLLARMTLCEKVGQMTQVEKNSILPEHIKYLGIGSLLSGGGGAPEENTPEAWAGMVDGFQALAVDTRLAIPLIYGVDAVHGHNNVKGATIFPHNVGLGAANDPELMRRIGQATAVEVAATGIHWNFAPTVAVPQDIRWGRTYEGYGETPDLVVPLAGAYLEGLQGADLSDRTAVLATAKHYVGDGGTTWGSATTAAQLIDQGVTEVDEAELRKTHLPPYVEAVERGAMSVMTSYSSWNDTRMHAHRYLVTDVLKGELGFEGFVISDWAAIDQISEDYYESVVAAFNAGIDMNMVPYDYGRFIWTLLRAVDNGDVPVERIDDAVRRILRVKFELGLFETPYSDPGLLVQVGSDDHRAVAREAVAKSAVLLKNEGDVLPIGDDANVIFVGGQAADDIGIQSGGWTIEWQGREGAITPGTTILEGVQASVVGGTEVLYDKFGNLDRVDRQNGAEPDLCIGVVGERPYAEGEGD